MIRTTKKVFLLILDGYGLRNEVEGNTVKLANTPYLHELFADPIQGSLSASGLDVGLPAGLMGNSEVGHLNLGAGRVVYQEIARIDREISTGNFFNNPVLRASVESAASDGSSWHLMGLVSDGGVHSSLNHLYALLELAKRAGAKQVFLHAFTDGRDTPPHSAVEYIRKVEQKMREIGVGKVATVSGRYWGMDRDQRWTRIERAYRMLTSGEGLKFGSAEEAISDSYRREVTDEFIEPSVITDNGTPVATIQSGDSVMFFNFRADRARELTMALTNAEFPHFERQNLDLHYTTMTQYHADFRHPIAFLPHHLANILAETIADAGLKQFRIAETEKYAHVTFFFNGGSETPFPGEERALIPSPKVATYEPCRLWMTTIPSSC